MSNIVFTTCNENPQLTPSDALAADALARAGVSVIAAPWNGLQKVFEEVDLIVIRSTWDYQKQPAAFRAWLATLENCSPTVNAPSLMTWNMSKRYLSELAACGAPLPPMRKIAPTAQSIAAAMDALGLSIAVAKPLIGATASGLSVVDRRSRESLAAAAAMLGGGGLLQPLIREVQTVGETSLIFFDGAFSHAVVKRPKDGDIRVQEEYGGASAPFDPPLWAIDQARDILNMLPGEALYARVDVIILDEALWLMEVELIEPELFFTYCPEAAARFAAALLKRL